MNLTMQYGTISLIDMNVYGLSADVGTDEADVKSIISQFFGVYIERHNKVELLSFTEDGGKSKKIKDMNTNQLYLPLFILILFSIFDVPIHGATLDDVKKKLKSFNVYIFDECGVVFSNECYPFKKIMVDALDPKVKAGRGLFSIPGMRIGRITRQRNAVYFYTVKLHPFLWQNQNKL